MTLKNLNPYRLPDIGLCRIKQIIGDPKANPPIPPTIPVSASAWWQGIKDGKYPKPRKLGPNTTVWRCEDIHALIAELSDQEVA